MSHSSNDPHVFECHLVWTGASQGHRADYQRYSREHRLDLAGKPSIVGTASPAFRGDPALPNPEDLLVAALASCHFLSYVALCASARIEIVSYEDDARGRMVKFSGGMRFSEVVLRPKVVLAPGSDVDKARALHEKAHAQCFIANSVNFEVRHEPDVRAGA